MKICVGLGNPGSRYASTRHNVGFRIAAALAKGSGIELFEERFAGLYGCARARWLDNALVGESPERGTNLGVLLPHTFMNRSGESVAAALAELPLGDLATDFAVVVDDLDLPFGRLRIRPAGGAGGHRGLESLIEHLGTRDFPRLRFGIGRPEPGGDPIEYVLAAFSEREERQLGERIEAAVEALRTLFRDGAAAAMDQFNRSPTGGSEDESAEPAAGPPES